MEQGIGFTALANQTVVYERIENIKPDHREQLMADLRARTGLDIKTIQVDKSDFLRDSVDIRIYYTGA